MASQQPIQQGPSPAYDPQSKEWNSRFDGKPEIGPAQLSHDAQSSQGWFTSFWSCCTPASLCCMAWCLPCITYGKIDHRLRNNGDLQDYSCCNGPCLLFTLASCCNVSCIPATMQRYEVREKYGIKGNCFVDFLAGWCCTCCVLVQADKEAEFREAQAHQRALLNRQYQGNAGMVYPQAAVIAPQASGIAEINPAPSAPTHTPTFNEKQ